MGARRPTARVRANRLNAKKSTGPKTPEGKRISSRNSFVDGLSIFNADTTAVKALSQSLLEDLVTPHMNESEIDALTNLASKQAQVIIIQSALNEAYELLHHHEKTKRTSTKLDADLIALHKQRTLLIALGEKPSISQRQMLDLEDTIKFVRRLARSKKSRATSVSRIQRYWARAIAHRRHAAEVVDDVQLTSVTARLIHPST